MPIDQRTLTMPAQWAKDAQTNIPTPPVPGIAYRKADLAASDLESGQAYDKVYDSARYNQVDYLTTGLVRSVEQHGIMPWSSLTDYPEHALCMGLDGVLYQALQPSGPGFGGTQAAVEGQYWTNYVARFLSPSYLMCEFYLFRHPTLRPGFQPAQGGLLANAKTLYPEAWEYLVNGAGQTLCKTEAEWQALTKATFATLDDGTAITWNGIGGAPFYAPNTSTGGLRLPDLRGMYQEAAGFDALGVGAVHGDGSRNFTGNFFSLFGIPQESNGIFKYVQGEVDSNVSGVPMGTGNWQQGSMSILSSRAVPTANKVQPRAWGALPCVYLGAPATV